MASSKQTTTQENNIAASLPPLLQNWAAPTEYFIDATQRTILYWDVLRQRSEQYYEQKAKSVPHVLNFDAELVLDARTFSPPLAKPVNYLLVRVKPPKGVTIDPKLRPFVVVDPRAGHGPGIGGFKADSELGVAMAAGHPCYFVGFTPEPVEGQTIEDIMHAEAFFLEKVIELHPEANGKPCIIGNCQAGWAVMMLAATRPELCGPVIIPGSPLSYWAGVTGENPMRYTGGLNGGSWVTALASDLGNGKFNGGYLVENFEKLNPANTYWTKSYDIWNTIDTGAQRFLDFEKWWGAHVNLNGEEIQWIVDQLFIGNRLSTGQITTQAGERIDLRNIRSPIICFCSKGDNITPPQQALGWICDLYDTDHDIKINGQTIIYAVHETVGHLGIFVSGGIAKKEHQEFASNIDLIDVLPPGLYEAVMTRKTSDTANADRVYGDWIVRFEPRTLDDVRTIVQPDPNNELRFAAAQRVSEINLAAYRKYLQPWVKTMVTAESAKLLEKFNPAQLPFEIFSADNPWMPALAQAAEQIRAQRKVAAPSNPWLVWQSALSQSMIASLETYQHYRDSAQETLFLAIYGSPALQAILGLNTEAGPIRSKAALPDDREEKIEQAIANLKANLDKGDSTHAMIRSLVYIGLAGEGVDERSFNELRLMRSENKTITLTEFKQMVREQFFSLLLDEQRAVDSIPKMLPADSKARSALLAKIRKVFEARGENSAAREARFKTIETLFNQQG